MEAVRKTRMASLVDGRGEAAELCQPRIRRDAGRTGWIRCREGAAPMARKRREAVVIARGAEAIADMGCHGHHQAFTDSTAWATWFSWLAER